MKLNGRFWAFILLVCVIGGVNGWDIDGVSRLRGVLAGIVGGAFLVTIYIASRVTSLGAIRAIVNASVGLICGLLCAGLLARGAAALIVYGLVGVLLGVSSDFWLSRV